MHQAIVEQIIKDCQAREDKDNAPPLTWTTEQLEDCILQLARDRGRP